MRRTRRLRDVVLTLVGLTAVAVVLVAADERVRDAAARAASPSGRTVLAHQVESRVRTVTAAAQKTGEAHAPFVAFGVAAAVLTVVMLRT